MALIGFLLKCCVLMSVLCACSYLDELGQAGESGAEFLALYKRLITPGHWKFYLALKGVLPRIGNLITTEIEELTLLEETTLSSDLSQGYALKALTGEHPRDSPAKSDFTTKVCLLCEIYAVFSREMYIVCIIY